MALLTYYAGFDEGVNILPGADQAHVFHGRTTGRRAEGEGCQRGASIPKEKRLVGLTAGVVSAGARDVDLALAWIRACLDTRSRQSPLDAAELRRHDRQGQHRDRQMTRRPAGLATDAQELRHAWQSGTKSTSLTAITGGDRVGSATPTLSLYPVTGHHYAHRDRLTAMPRPPPAQKITDVVPALLAPDFDPRFTSSAQDSFVVVIRTDGGVDGVGGERREPVDGQSVH